MAENSSFEVAVLLDLSLLNFSIMREGSANASLRCVLRTICTGSGGMIHRLADGENHQKRKGTGSSPFSDFGKLDQPSVYAAPVPLGRCFLDSFEGSAPTRVACARDPDSALGIVDHLQRTFARFKLGAHFL